MLLTLARDLIRDLIDYAEDRDTDAILARRELREKDILFNTRKTRKTGKRVANTSLQKRISLSKLVRDLEERTKKKKTKKGRKKTKYTLISSEEKEEEEDSVDELASLVIQLRR
jgi:hypothetical protein